MKRSREERTTPKVPTFKAPPIGKEKEAAAKAPAASTAPKSGLVSEKIFDLMKTFLARGEGKHLIPKVKAVFGFEILEKKGGKPTCDNRNEETSAVYELLAAIARHQFVDSPKKLCDPRVK